jgi:hypothetical protein
LFVFNFERFNQIIVGTELALANQDENNNATDQGKEAYRTNFSKTDLEIYRRKAFKLEASTHHQHSTRIDLDVGQALSVLNFIFLMVINKTRKRARLFGKGNVYSYNENASFQIKNLQF